MTGDDYRDICHLAAAMEPDARAVLRAAAACTLLAPKRSTAEVIAATCDAVKAMLLAKNEAYGDSATRPIRVMSKASAKEQLLVRIDDKLSRIVRGHAAGEDVVRDLTGYFMLLLVLEELEKEAAK